MVASLATALVVGALLGRRVARGRGCHRPRALELVIEPRRPVCCSWCCPSGHFRGTMPPGYSTRCRCTGGCGHSVREKGASFPNPAPWDDPIDMPTPGPGVRRG